MICTSSSGVMSLIQHHSALCSSLPFNSYLPQHNHSNPSPQNLTHFHTTYCCQQYSAQYLYGGSHSKVYCVSKMKIIVIVAELWELLDLNGCIRRTCTEKTIEVTSLLVNDSAKQIVWVPVRVLSHHTLIRNQIKSYKPTVLLERMWAPDLVSYGK